MSKRVLATLMGSIVFGAPSPAVAAEHEAALWVVGQVEAPLGDSLSAHLMLQARTVGDVDDYERTVIRPWLAAALSHGFEAALGYDAHFFESPTGFLESRSWQRIAHQHDFGALRSQLHLWQEQRYIDGDNEVASRTRVNVGAVVPLSDSLTAVIRNEFFINLNRTESIADTGLGEDHFFVGLRTPFGLTLSAEVGYLMQFRERRGPDLFDHSLVLGFSIVTPELADIW